MEIYLSAGPATIAALMAVDRVGVPTMLRCERAVVTAYVDLLVHGTAEPAARQACVTVYRNHHPEVPVAEARRLVDGWVTQHCGPARPEG